MQHDRKLTWVFVLLFVVGAALISSSHLHILDGKPALIGELLRDLGIAFCIAVVVAAIIEVSLSRKAYLRGLDAIMMRTVPDDVWQDFRQHVVTQSLMREDWSVTMNLGAVNAGKCISTTTLRYTIVALEDALNTVVRHELDSHRTPTGTSVRFTRAKIGERHYPDHSALKSLVSADELTLTLPVRIDKYEGRVPVEVEFSEQVGCPDTVSWWMYRVTRNVTLRIKGVPAGWRAETVTLHPAPHKLVRTSSSEWTFGGIMLPGQGIELRIGS